MIPVLRSAVATEEGQGLAEYGIILGMIAIVCIVAIAFLGGGSKFMLTSVGSSI